MTERARFDAWFATLQDAGADFAWQAWQAAARAERERCAVICDQLAVMSLDPMVCRGSAEECAEAIRSQP